MPKPASRALLACCFLAVPPSLAGGDEADARRPGGVERAGPVRKFDITERVGPKYVPSRASVGKPLTAFAAPGEFEPAAFCIRATRDLGSVSTVRAPSSGQVNVSLLSGERLVAEQTGQGGSGQLRGTFVDQGLAPGVYTLQAGLSGSRQAPPSARRQVIVSPDPFDWKAASTK